MPTRVNYPTRTSQSVTNITTAERLLPFEHELPSDFDRLSGRAL